MTFPTPLRRRWFSFSLRTLFVLVTIFGVWLGVQVKWIRDRGVELDQLRADGAQIQAGNAPWPIRILGAEGVAQVVFVRLPWNAEPTHAQFDGVDSARRERIARLFPEAKFEELYCF